MTITDEILHERQRQNAKWGVQRHNWAEWASILTEEVGEAATDANKARWANDDETAERHVRQLRTELIQSAAVAVQIIEHIDEVLDAIGFVDTNPEADYISDTRDFDDNDVPARQPAPVVGDEDLVGVDIQYGASHLQNPQFENICVPEGCTIGLRAQHNEALAPSEVRIAVHGGMTVQFTLPIEQAKGGAE